MTSNFATEVDSEIDKIMLDRRKFNDFVYTPFEEAKEELFRRHCKIPLSREVQESLPKEMLSLICENKCAFLHRPLVTDNYEVLRFINTIESVHLKPVFLEYSNDKFVTRNEWKHALGRLGFFLGRGRNGGEKIDYVNSINFTESDGLKLSEVQTLWGQSLINFHHEIFLRRFPSFQNNIFDGLDWYSNHGGKPQQYYEPFFHLVVSHGILFDNFLLEGEELAFTRNVIIPALLEVRRKTGLKPLIVSLEPTENESNRIWMCHPPDILPWIKERSKII